MPFYRFDDIGLVHVKYSRKSAAPPHCSVDGCLRVGGYLCDFKTGRTTCDKPMCEKHAHEVGTDRHYCGHHHRVFQATDLFARAESP